MAACEAQTHQFIVNNILLKGVSFNLLIPSFTRLWNEILDACQVIAQDIPIHQLRAQLGTQLREPPCQQLLPDVSRSRDAAIPPTVQIGPITRADGRTVEYESGPASTELLKQTSASVEKSSKKEKSYRKEESSKKEKSSREE